MVQFNKYIYELSRRFNWEVHLAALPAGNKLEKEAHPMAKAREPRVKTKEVGATPINDTTFESFEQRIRSFAK